MNVFDELTLGESIAFAVDGQYTDTGKPILITSIEDKNTYPSRYHLVNLNLNVNGKKINLRGAAQGGQFQIVSGSNGFISWASAPLNIDLHDTYVDSQHNHVKGHLYHIDVRDKGQKEVKTFNTTKGLLLSGLLFNEVENVPTISFSHPLMKPDLNIFAPILNLPLCETIECAIDALKNLDQSPSDYIVIDDKRIAHTQSGIIPIRDENTGSKMGMYNETDHIKGYVQPKDKKSEFITKPFYVAGDGV